MNETVTVKSDLYSTHYLFSVSASFQLTILIENEPLATDSRCLIKNGLGERWLSR